MNVLVTGGTGFIGSALCRRLLEDKHDVTVLTRHPDTIKASLKSIVELEQLKDELVFNSVINLAGEPIANKRWSDKQKQRIVNSRLETTQKLISYFKTREHKPKLFISGSAIGYYGIDESNDSFDESASGDDSFSSQLCQQWEAAALQAQALGIRTCLLRTGIVLGEGGGALSKMLLAFRMGLGGRMGQGKHWMSWIHLDDLVGVILHCSHHTNLHGAINGTSPNPVTNKTFTKTLGKVLERPAILPMPGLLLKLLMGQMARELLLAGKKILPVKALNAGYHFKHEELESALLNAV